MAVQRLDPLDVTAVVIYFLMVLAAGFYAMYRSQRSTVSGYFLAGRFMTWLPVGASIFASNIGSEHFIGLAGSGAAAGIAVGAFEFNALILLQLLGWVFLPVYIASKVCTLPGYMSRRFGGKRIQMFLAVLSLILYIFTKLSVNLFSGAIFIRETFGWDLYFSTILLLAMTCICTVTGGLAAVIYTDTLQCVIMLFGASLLMFKIHYFSCTKTYRIAIVTGFISLCFDNAFHVLQLDFCPSATGLLGCLQSFSAVGGFSGLMEKYEFAIASDVKPNSTCGYPRSDAWSMLRDPVNSDMPWPGFLLGQTPASIWYWCADQMMVQRTLAAKSLSHAQGATLFAGYLKILPIFLMVFPGMISRVLYPDVIACSDPDVCYKHCGSRLGCSNLAYPKLVLELMPAGLRGVMFAVMLAALMSDLTSVFNSASTLFTMDIWKYLRPSAQTKELLLVGKSFVLVMVGASIAWIPIILQMQGGQLYLYIQAVAAYLSPPIAAVYLTAILVKRLNEKGAFWSLMLGFFLGFVRMGLDFYYPEPACGEVDLRPVFVSSFHYMYFAAFLFWTTIVVSLIISLMTEPPSKSQLVRTTFWTRYSNDKRDDENENVEMTVTGAKETNGSVSDGVISIPPGSESTIQLHVKDDASVSPSQIPFWKKFYYWFCGYDYEGRTSEEGKAMQEHLDDLSNLEQDPGVKLFLNINLVIIIVLGVGLYVFFSLVMPTL